MNVENSKLGVKSSKEARKEIPEKLTQRLRGAEARREFEEEFTRC